MTAEKNVCAGEIVPESASGIKAQEVARHFRKVRSLFINPMGAICRTALIAVLLVSVLALVGCGKSEDNGSENKASGSNAVDKADPKRHVPTDTLVVKGLYMGMPGDDAVEACKEMVASSKDLVVVDFRNGIEREKDDSTKAAEKKDYAEKVKQAELDVDGFTEWGSFDIQLNSNSITSLPSGVFNGLNSLSSLDLTLNHHSTSTHLNVQYLVSFEFQQTHLHSL